MTFGCFEAATVKPRGPYKWTPEKNAYLLRNWRINKNATAKELGHSLKACRTQFYFLQGPKDRLPLRIQA